MAALVQWVFPRRLLVLHPQGPRLQEGILQKIFRYRYAEIAQLLVYILNPPTIFKHPLQLVAQHYRMACFRLRLHQERHQNLS